MARAQRGGVCGSDFRARGYVSALYDRSEGDFPSLRAYNDYLEEAEALIQALAEGDYEAQSKAWAAAQELERSRRRPVPAAAAEAPPELGGETGGAGGLYCWGVGAERQWHSLVAPALQPAAGAAADGPRQAAWALLFREAYAAAEPEPHWARPG
eukprot:TRINITY_DN43128_c0_g1_i1.p2 TRINITY_DN43128_c0_g1~~TRINITY_DN43128_c0_g1_i1.p2  ORF type:complete len:155 (+),score=49.24 TRINITY_DN43128_c0_g1_i1:69-533(+)